MAPKKAKDPLEAKESSSAPSSAATTAKPSKGGKSKASSESLEELDALLGIDNDRSWVDSFMILSAARFLFRQVLELTKSPAVSPTSPQAPAAGGKKKEKERGGDKEELPLKDAALQFLNDFKIPVGLLCLFVFTCAIIAGGEGYNKGEDRPREALDDYYKVLGVPRDAETADVKRAYKTLAKMWHPDRNPNCSTCQDTFAKIAVAYETLSDDGKRAAYDESGEVATAELKSPRSVPLTRDNFDALVTFSNDVWIVQVFRPDDHACAQFHPFWENQTQKLGNLVRFGRIDVTNDQAKWLQVRVRVLPLVLKFSRHLGTPEIFPITALHETSQKLTKFIVNSFPNIGLPMTSDEGALSQWIASYTRRHKVFFAIPGRSKEERLKSHLVVRKLASRWSEIFEFRTAETSVLHSLLEDKVPKQVKAHLPPAENATSECALMLFPARGDAKPRLVARLPWPAGEDAIVLELMRFAQLVAPPLSAQSADLLCRSLASQRVYCLVLLDPSDEALSKATKELEDSRDAYAKEVATILAGGGEVDDEEDNFIVTAMRLLKHSRGLLPSISDCHAPKFGQVEKALGSATAFLLDFDIGRMAALPGQASYRGLYPQLAYEDTLKWIEDVVHPYLSLPDCNEAIGQRLGRNLRSATTFELVIFFVQAVFVAEILGKAASIRSVKWCASAGVLISAVALMSPPVQRLTAGYLPAILVAPSFG